MKHYITTKIKAIEKDFSFFIANGTLPTGFQLLSPDITNQNENQLIIMEIQSNEEEFSIKSLQKMDDLINTCMAALEIRPPKKRRTRRSFFDDDEEAFFDNL